MLIKKNVDEMFIGYDIKVGFELYFFINVLIFQNKQSFFFFWCCIMFKIYYIMEFFLDVILKLYISIYVVMS